MTTPSLDSLRCFVEVARALNFRAAARVVALTPAAVSGRIRQLEDLLGHPLFERTTRKVSLTPAGLALLPQAKLTLEAAAACVDVARGGASVLARELTVGTRHELGMSWLLPALPQLEAAVPRVTFHLFFGFSDELLARVRSRSIDCAVGSMRCADPAIATEPLHEERYVLVGQPGLLKRQPLARAAEAKTHRLLDIEPGLPLSAYLRDARGDEVPFGEARFLGTIAAVRALALGGEGVAVLPEYLVREDLRRKKLVRLLPRRQILSDWFRLFFRADDERRPLYGAIAGRLRTLPLR